MGVAGCDERLSWAMGCERWELTGCGIRCVLPRMRVYVGVNAPCDGLCQFGCELSSTGVILSAANNLLWRVRLFAALRMTSMVVLDLLCECRWGLIPILVSCNKKERPVRSPCQVF